jgi:hypothetical protein
MLLLLLFTILLKVGGWDIIHKRNDHNLARGQIVK